MKIDSVDHVAIQNAQYVAAQKRIQERVEEHYANKNRIQEHHNKKINLDKRMLEAYYACLLYTSPSPRDLSTSRMPSSA